MTETGTGLEASSEVLFYEPGASWWWVLAGPAAGIAMAMIQLSAGYGIQWLVPTHLLRARLGVPVRSRSRRPGSTPRSS